MQNPIDPVKAKRKIEIRSFVVSRFALDGGAMFGVIPRPIWERAAVPDSKGRISLVTRVLVARFPKTDRVLVVDSGMGQEWGTKNRRRYCIDQEVPTIAECLGKLGIEPENVTDAILTHLHFDHAGGWTKSEPAGRFVPVFPKATHYVQKAQLDLALEPSKRDRASFIREHFEPLVEHGLIQTLDGSCHLGDGVEVLALTGHTPGLQIPVIRGEKETVVFPSDLIPTAAHLSLPWIMAYDLYPLATLKEKTELLDLSAKHNWTLILQHDPAIAAVRVTGQGEQFEISPCECPQTI